MKFKDEWNQLIKSIDQIRLENGRTEFSENLLDLFVAGEDHRFWLHFGVDPIGLVRAFWKTAFCNRREGGSTIAMQLVRTITKRYEISSQRKLKEIYLATRITLALERKEILQLYLNIAYFGWNMHGLEQTCKVLDLDKSALTNYEAASIVARLKYPEPRFNKNMKLKAINLRANHIINRFNQFNSKGYYGTV
jgi:membrane peptidoglycan carboxypeptidase